MITSGHWHPKVKRKFVTEGQADKHLESTIIAVVEELPKVV